MPRRESHDLIDHDPNEPKIDRGPGPWKIAFPVLAVVFLLNVATREVDWVSIALGVAVGGVLTAWAIEVTGNKVPDWWKSKPPGTGRS
ncbi:hypothetical protein CFBP6626_07195 [Agrobacterium tumefaciens]|nr:hypothetical protein CFBP6626_07195 [Agrobacterium tumefaciens]CUX21312.1 conserved hypothetical protein [Agrobacterium genomosp. 5 str. CFBP 6626]